MLRIFCLIMDKQLHSTNNSQSTKRHLEQNCKFNSELPVTVVLGAQWGDEGKGKITNWLVYNNDIVCRCQGGNNADHVVVIEDRIYNFHLVPTGIIHQKCTSVIGNGVVIHLPALFDELDKFQKQGLTNCRERLLISERSHLVFDFHQQVDKLLEEQKESESIGTTIKGIGPTYSCKSARTGIRVIDLLGDFQVFASKFKSLVKNYQDVFPSLHVDCETELRQYKFLAEEVRQMVTDTTLYLQNAVKERKKILVEGANAGMLDIDFGTYPYVTSSNCTIGGVCTGLGIPPKYLGEIIGVVKLYTTRVGNGHFPTELNNDIGKLFQTVGNEVGCTTDRKRRCGWLDIPVVCYTNMINGYTGLALTKLDILDSLSEVKIGVSYWKNGNKINNFPASNSDLAAVEVKYLTLPGWQTSTQAVQKYEELPVNARRYIEKIQELVDVPVKWIGTGRERDAIIEVPFNLHTSC